MIKVSIKEKNDLEEIIIKGHAKYDEYGKDIVCASVSSIVITSVNAIMRIDDQAIDYNDKNGVFIKVLKHTEVIDKLLDNLIDLLNELSRNYPKYIEMRRC